MPLLVCVLTLIIITCSAALGQTTYTTSGHSSQPTQPSSTPRPPGSESPSSTCTGQPPNSTQLAVPPTTTIQPPDSTPPKTTTQQVATSTITPTPVINISSHTEHTSPEPIQMSARNNIELKALSQIDSEGSITVELSWEINNQDPNFKKNLKGYTITCKADIKGQQDTHIRSVQKLLTSAKIEYLQGEQNYICCVEVRNEPQMEPEMNQDRQKMSLKNCTVVETQAVSVISSIFARLMIAVAVVLFLIMVTVSAILCIVVCKERTKKARLVKYNMTNPGCAFPVLDHVTQRPLPHPYRLSGTYETIPDHTYEHTSQHGNTKTTRTGNKNKDEHNLSEKEESQEKNGETPPKNTEATPTTSNVYHVLESIHNEAQDTTEQSVEYNITTPQDYEVPSSTGVTGEEENTMEKK